ncbi:hypothetical protein LPJ66_009223 [Kickxella alabastrina]|uniref:Uncharacterized protein n=1 Tax=Kickxella alabastrina TaxID=61397 RepID=A0ACC1I5E8_9FUNG|nr:hypothetical protein LPJ66_009223 [Kickxella alabastrina]
MALKLDAPPKFNDFVKLTNTANKVYPAVIFFADSSSTCTHETCAGIRPLLAHIRSNRDIARSQYDSSKFHFAKEEYDIESKCGVLFIRSGNYLTHMEHYLQPEFEEIVKKLFTMEPADSPRVKAKKAAEAARLLAEEEAKKKAFEAARRRAEQERMAQSQADCACCIIL